MIYAILFSLAAFAGFAAGYWAFGFFLKSGLAPDFMVQALMGTVAEHYPDEVERIIRQLNRREVG